MNKVTEWFLRISLSAGFLSASADRLGMWPKDISTWGNWRSFVDYTGSLLPFLPGSWVPIFAYIATILEILFGILLLTTFQTKEVARASVVLLLLFALSMTISKGIKAPLDYSVFTAAAAALALNVIVSEKRGKARS